MRLLFLAIFVVAAVCASAVPAPYPQPMFQPYPLPLKRTARASPQPKEIEKPGDLEGSESAYIAYPYVYPYAWHSPYVWVGK